MSGRFTHWGERFFRARVRLGELLYKTFARMMFTSLKARIYECEISAGKIRYWKTQAGHRETILFFHGFADSMEGVYPLAYHLTSRFDLIVPDLPGFGESFKRPDLSHSFEVYQGWISEFIEAAGVDAVHLVGNSFGGSIAIMLARIRPDIVKSLTLINSAGVNDFQAPSLYDEILAGQYLFQITSQKELMAFWRRVFERPPPLPPLVREFFLQRFRDNFEWYGYLFREIFGKVKDRDDPLYKELFFNQHLSQLKFPALIIWGAEDRLLPLPFGQLAHRLLQGSRLIVLDGVGHVPQIERPRLVAKHLGDFILRRQKEG